VSKRLKPLTDFQRRLVEEHMWIAEHLAKVVSSHSVGHADEIAEAAWWGLCLAGRKFDPSLGVQFKTYAWLRVNGAILDVFRNRSAARWRQLQFPGSTALDLHPQEIQTYADTA